MPRLREFVDLHICATGYRVRLREAQNAQWRCRLAICASERPLWLREIVGIWL